MPQAEVRRISHPHQLSAAVALTRLWNPEFPQVSHPRFCPGDTPLPSSGSRWPRFPALLGTMRVLRLPAPHALRLIDSPAGGSVGACIGFVSAKAIPAVSKPRAGPGVLVIRISISGTYLHGQMRDLPGCLATHPMTSRRSRDFPDDPWHLEPGRDGARHPVLVPPVTQQRGRHHWNFRGSIAKRFVTSPV